MPVLAIAFLAFGVSLTGILAQQKVHAQAPTTTPQAAVVSSVNNAAESGAQSTVDKESADRTSGAAENENDSPGGHQDAQGASVDHQFEGAE